MTNLHRGVAPLALALLVASPAQGADLFGEPVLHEAPAATQGSAISGRLELRGTYLEVQENGFEGTDALSGAVTGTVNVQLGRAFNAQLDLRGTARSVDGYDSETYSGTTHLYFRPEGGRYAAGGFASIEGLRLTDVDVATGTELFSEIDSYLGGVEMAYLGRAFTVLARLGYGEISTDLGPVEIAADRYTAELGARYYLTPNLRFDLGGGVQRFEVEGASQDSYSIEAAANWRPNGGHYSIFGGVRRDRTDATDTIYTGFFGGAKLHFGTGSLQDEDRGGALWSPVVSLE